MARAIEVLHPTEKAVAEKVAKYITRHYGHLFAGRSVGLQQTGQCGGSGVYGTIENSDNILFIEAVARAYEDGLRAGAEKNGGR